MRELRTTPLSKQGDITAHNGGWNVEASPFVHSAGQIVVRVTASPVVVAAARKTALPMRGMVSAPICDERANFAAACESFADDIRDNGWDLAKEWARPI